MPTSYCQWWYSHIDIDGDFDPIFIYFITECENIQNKIKNPTVINLCDNDVEGYFKYIDNKKHCLHCGRIIEVIDMDKDYRELHKDFYEKYTINLDR